ncbi:disease resistance protein RPS2-like [Dioscorea cayenensis subsp. rotundata]|uniref:Disease resistance protein RPS2-like n=1 Tax=Dioscorea cayennensis subsp. rotundata TaxID=55577 RepID=A0AB40CKD2_DIOCR|nr:disease resistance protein RPS2-like [Dioscorea cayenensis subsp. rotundata]
MNLINPVVSSVVPYVLNPIMRQFKYLFLPNNNVKAVVDAMDVLRAKKDIQNAKREGEDCSPEMEFWLEKVENIERDVAAIKQEYYLRKKCIGISSLNLVSNYKIGKRAFKTKEELMQLLNKSSKFEVICRYLKENTAGIVGIWGMRGVGKTILLRSINNEFIHNKDGMFDHVIWVAVSQNNIEKVQSDIAKYLGLSSADASAICDFLSRKSFLLLLDDLWSSLDLETIGVPEIQHDAQDENKRMVVFTTQSKAICRSMEADTKIRMEPLDDDAAWSLFNEKAGKELIASDEKIEYHAKDITEKCAGLPLVLVTVGKVMSTKKSPQDWEGVATMMGKFPGMKEPSLFPFLKISYDSLEGDSLRQCFLYCSLWGEDEQIPTDELIECWMGHGLLGDFDELNEAYIKGETIIGLLKEACLLESGVLKQPVLKSSDLTSNVKLHGMVRDLALWIASDCHENKRGWLVKRQRNLKRLPKDLSGREVISLANNKLRSLDQSAKFNKLRTFMLQGNENLDLISPGFFMTMHFLKYLDLSKTSITTLPEEIRMLQELQYLNLSFSSIISLPSTLGDLNQLKYLYCGKASNLKDIPQDLIPRLTKLNVLDLYSTGVYFFKGAYLDDMENFLCKLKGVGINIEGVSALKRLSCVPKQKVQLTEGFYEYLTSVSISPSLLGINSKTSLQELQILGISPLKELVMKTEHEDSWCLSHLKSLRLKFHPKLRNIIWEDLEARHFLPKLAYLSIYKCDSLTSLSWVAQLPSLQILKIRKCCKLMSIIADDHHKMIEDGTPFQSLKTLILDNLPDLDSIYEGKLSFPSIEAIILSKCWKLGSLPLGYDSAKNMTYISVKPGYLWDDMNWAFKCRFSRFVVQRSVEWTIFNGDRKEAEKGFKEGDLIKEDIKTMKTDPKKEVSLIGRGNGFPQVVPVMELIFVSNEMHSSKCSYEIL